MKYHLLNSLLTLCLLFSFWGCKHKDVEPNTGNLYIQVKDQYGRSISGAVISAEPAIPQTRTDEFGSVLIKNLPVGAYEIIANKAGTGSGKVAVQVKPNDVVSTTILIEYGKFMSFAPTVDIAFPVVPANFGMQEPIMFKAYVTDNDTPVESLEIKWESSKDGVLNTDKPTKDGVVTFSTSSLSRALHLVVLTVKDKSGNTSKDSVLVSTLAPKQINLDKPTRVNGGVSLTWSKSPDSDFKEYRIYRSNENCDETSKVLLNVITDVNTVTYADEKPPLTTKACYFVEVVTTQQQSRRSVQQQVDYPGGLLFSYTPNDADIHPTKPLLFLCSRDKEQVIVYDYEKGETVAELQTPRPSGNILVADNGNGLNVYVPSQNNSLYIYDANTYAFKRVIMTDAQATDVAVSGKGHVFITVYNQWTNPIGSYVERTGMLIGYAGYCMYGGGRIRKVPNRNELISISTGISPIDMDYLAFDDNGTITRCRDDNQHGDYPLDPYAFRISPSGTYLLTGGSGALYQPNETMKYMGLIASSTGLNYSDFAFSEDEKTFYASTSSRRSVQIGKLPELTRTDELLTRGYPSKMFRKGNTLILISRTVATDYYYNYGAMSAVEVLKLP